MMMRILLSSLAPTVFLLIISCGEPTDNAMTLDPTKREAGLFGETLIISPNIGTENTKFTLTVSLANEYDAEFDARWDFDNDGNFETPWLDSLYVLTELSEIEDSLTCQIRRSDGFWSQITWVCPVVSLENVTKSLPAQGQENVDISPEGDRIVFNWRFPTNEHQVYEMDLITGTYIQISTSTGHFPDYSYNGNLIAYDGGDGLHIYDRESSSDTLLFPDTRWRSNWVRWSPKELTFITMTVDGMIIYDYLTHIYETIAANEFSTYCWNSEGNKIAFSNAGHNTIAVYDVASSAYVQYFGAQDVGAKLDWSPNGKFLSLGVLVYPNLLVLDLERENVITINPGDIRQTWYPSWAPDGTSLYFEGIGPEDSYHSIWKIGFPIDS